MTLRSATTPATSYCWLTAAARFKQPRVDFSQKKAQAIWKPPTTFFPTPSLPMPSYGLTKRGFKLLGFVLLSSIGLLVYIRWHNILQAFSGPRLPPLYEKVRTKEQSLPHYREYERKGVKYFFAANHARSKSWYMTTIHDPHSLSCSRFRLGERHARFCYDGFARPHHQSIVSISCCFVFISQVILRTSNIVNIACRQVSCLMTTFGTRTAHFTQSIMAN